VALVGPFITIGFYERRLVNGAASCNGLDLVPFIVGGLVLLATLAGFRAIHQNPLDHLLPKAVNLSIGGVLGALGVVYLLRGVLDPAGSYC
jgi:hypothetical protein